MDKFVPKETIKSGILNGRYVLGECLFANEPGQLYHARDTRHSSGTAPGSHVLLHLFPSHAISYNNLPAVFKRIQTITTALAYPVLPVLDYGWTGTKIYFVLPNPDSWVTKVLPPLRGKPSSLHRNAMQISHGLAKDQLISNGLVAQSFLVIPGGVKLLATALTEQYQENQPVLDLLPPPNKHSRVRLIPTILGFGLLAGVAIAGGSYFYQQVSGQNIAPPAENRVAVNTPFMTAPPPAPTINPTQESPEISISPQQDIPQKPEISDEIAPPDAEDKPADTQIVATGAVPEESAVPEKTVAETIAEPTTVAIIVSEQPGAAEETTTTSLPGERSESKNKPQEHPALNKSKLTANGFTSEQLIAKAYAAIRQGSLNEQPGSGGIYYIRLLRRIAPQHPQVHRLSREVVAAYHVKARTALRLKQSRQATRHLWMAGRVINEFDLAEMRKAHLILEQRLNE